jgi:hypothetical protein
VCLLKNENEIGLTWIFLSWASVCATLDFSQESMSASLLADLRARRQRQTKVRRLHNTRCNKLCNASCRRHSIEPKIQLKCTQNRGEICCLLLIDYFKNKRQLRNGDSTHTPVWPPMNAAGVGVGGVRDRDGATTCLFSALAFSFSSHALISDMFFSVLTLLRNASESGVILQTSARY